MSTVPDKIDPPVGLSYGEPTWDIARLYPAQGTLDRAGVSEPRHQSIGGVLTRLHRVSAHAQNDSSAHRVAAVSTLESFASARSQGTAVAAPLSVQLWPEKFREPDVVFMLAEHASRITEDYWIGADLVMEVVSGSDE